MSEQPTAQPVEVTNSEPMPVSVVEHHDQDSPAQSIARKTAASARVDAEALRTDDQRRISGMWERTQQVIALAVVLDALFVVTVLVVGPGIATLLGYPVPESASAAASTGVVFLASVANLVIGFYFGRTNHTRVGGVPADERGR